MKMRYMWAMGLMTMAGICGAMEMPAARISGDYVEARTASVFAGACHYNGELVTTGKDAVAAWHVTGGAWNGVDLSGVKAFIAVTSDESLGDKGNRKSELVVDCASDAQMAAFSDMVREKAGESFGTITNARRGSVSFVREKGVFEVASKGLGSMHVEPMPDMECCKQPNLVWFSPLFEVKDKMVGYTTRAAYTSGKLGDRWQREDENDAFYGHFGD